MVRVFTLEANARLLCYLTESNTLRPISIPFRAPPLQAEKPDGLAKKETLKPHSVRMLILVVLHCLNLSKTKQLQNAFFLRPP